MVVRIMALTAALLAAVPAKTPAKPEQPLSPRLLRLSESCQKNRGIYALAFQRHLERRQKNAAWRILIRGADLATRRTTAERIAKAIGSKLHRVEPSKYIGETEKNLAQLFDKAERKDWILFFDEADALFGKRTEIKDAHDRYANAEASYLPEELEKRADVVILAANDDVQPRGVHTVVDLTTGKALSPAQLFNRICWPPR